MAAWGRREEAPSLRRGESPADTPISDSRLEDRGRPSAVQPPVGCLLTAALGSQARLGAAFRVMPPQRRACPKPPEDLSDTVSLTFTTGGRVQVTAPRSWTRREGRDVSSLVSGHGAEFLVVTNARGSPGELGRILTFVPRPASPAPDTRKGCQPAATPLAPELFLWLSTLHPPHHHQDLQQATCDVSTERESVRPRSPLSSALGGGAHGSSLAVGTRGQGGVLPAARRGGECRDRSQREPDTRPS